MPGREAPQPDLHESEREANPKGIVWEARTDNGILTQIGGEPEEVLGLPARLMVTLRWTDLIHPDDRDRVSAIVSGIVASGNPTVFDARFLGADSRVIWLRSAVRVVPGESVPHLRCVAFDISDLKRAQSDFDKARRRLSYLASVSRILASSLDYEKTLLNAVQAAVPEIADWCAVRIIAPDGAMTRLAEVHSDPSRAALLNEISRRFPPSEKFGPRKVIRTGAPEFFPDTAGLADQVAVDEEHLAMLRQIGFTSYLCVPMRGREAPLGVISMAITDSGRRFSESDLQLAEELAARATMALDNARLYRDTREELKRRENFMALLGHELRNPLSAIANAVEVLENRGADDPGTRRLHGILQRQSFQLSRLVDDLLDVARVTHGKIALNLKPVDLGLLATRCVHTLQDTHSIRERTIELTVSDEHLIVEADEVRLEQIILNLLTNALKYTASGGRISVEILNQQTRPGHDQAVLVVADDGIGISAADLPHIFEVFHQAAPAHKASGGVPGLGLGLALVQQLIRLHGGSVEASSEGPGLGSRFTVRLPRSSHHASVREGPAGARLKRRILVVDDNPDALESLRLMLELAGHEVKTAINGQSGFELMKSWRPEVAVIDIGLPDIDGYQLAAEIRALESEAPPFLIALTGYGQPEDRARAFEAGFDLHLIKPLNIDEFIQMLGSQLPASCR